MSIDGLESQEWWQAVRSIADLVNRDGIAVNQDRLIRQELAGQGFSPDVIGRALEWVDQVVLSGNLMDALGMLQPLADHVRIEHPLEQLSLSPQVSRLLNTCRRQGIVSPEMAERLIEGLRLMDARDWEQDEVEEFFADVLHASVPNLEVQMINHLIGGRPRRELN